MGRKRSVVMHRELAPVALSVWRRKYAAKAGHFPLRAIFQRRGGCKQHTTRQSAAQHETTKQHLTIPPQGGSEHHSAAQHQQEKAFWRVIATLTISPSLPPSTTTSTANRYPLQQGRPKFERPVADANAPDLYVPLMSFITFVLVTGYAKGSAAALNAGAGKFSPEVSSHKNRLQHQAAWGGVTRRGCVRSVRE